MVDFELEHPWSILPFSLSGRLLLSLLPGCGEECEQTGSHGWWCWPLFLLVKYETPPNPGWFPRRPQNRWHHGLFSCQTTLIEGLSTGWRSPGTPSVLLPPGIASHRRDPRPAQPNQLLRGGVEQEVRWSCWSLPSHIMELLGSCPYEAVSNRRENLLLLCWAATPQEEEGVRGQEYNYVFVQYFHYICPKFAACYQYGTSMVPVWYQHGTSMVLAWYEHGTSMVLVWYQHGTSMVLAWYEHGTSMVLFWYQHGTSMVLAWYEHGTSVESAWSYYRTIAVLAPYCRRRSTLWPKIAKMISWS